MSRGTTYQHRIRVFQRRQQSTYSEQPVREGDEFVTQQDETPTSNHFKNESNLLTFTTLYLQRRALCDMHDKLPRMCAFTT